MIFHGKCSNQGNVRLPWSPSKLQQLAWDWGPFGRYCTKHEKPSIIQHLLLPTCVDGYCCFLHKRHDHSIQLAVMISNTPVNPMKHWGTSTSSGLSLPVVQNETRWVPILGGVAPKLGDSFGPQYLLGRIYNYHRHYLSYSSCCLFDCLVHFEVQQFWAIALKGCFKGSISHRDHSLTKHQGGYGQWMAQLYLELAWTSGQPNHNDAKSHVSGIRYLILDIWHKGQICTWLKPVPQSTNK